MEAAEIAARHHSGNITVPGLVVGIAVGPSCCSQLDDDSDVQCASHKMTHKYI
jgi:hypothetical protein